MHDVFLLSGDDGSKFLDFCFQEVRPRLEQLLMPFPQTEADQCVLVARETERVSQALESRLKCVNRVTVLGLDFLRHGQKV